MKINIFNPFTGKPTPVDKNFTKVLSYGKNVQLINTGLAEEYLLRIAVPAGTLKAGQALKFECWGELTNTLGTSYILASMDGNDMAGTSSFLLPALGVTRAFHMEGYMQFNDGGDNATQNGKFTVTNQTTGAVVAQIVPQNAGGNNIEDEHLIEVRCLAEAPSTYPNFTVIIDQWQLTLIDGNKTPIPNTAP